MTTTAEGTPALQRPGVVGGIVRRFVQVIIVFAVQAALLFGLAGKIDWTWAWVYIGISFASMAINSAFLLRKSPEVIAERGKPGTMKQWDKIFSVLYSVFLFLLVPLIAGLDERHGWSGTIGIPLNLLGGVVLASGLGFAGWAMIANAYFSTVVRIQTDRGHTVCTTGPYRYVRHPGYVGFILQSLGTPVLLGSLWGLIPGAAAAISLVIRTSFEDRTLLEELPGYREYAEETRYRLMPEVW